MDTFVTELSQRIAYCSEADLSFCGRMKATVHSADFYARVENLRESHKVGEGTFLGISFGFTCAKKGVPKGSFLIPSHCCLAEVAKICAEHHIEAPRTAHEYSTFLTKESWVISYKMVFNMDTTKINPKITKYYDSRFDLMKDYFRSFHVMRPVLLEDPDECTAVHRLLDVLAGNDLDPISFRTLKSRKPSMGLLKCDCVDYLHYGWCLHTCAYAFERGIIRKYPKYMDPKGLVRGPRKPGQPRKAKGIYK